MQAVFYYYIVFCFSSYWSRWYVLPEQRIQRVAWLPFHQSGHKRLENIHRVFVCLQNQKDPWKIFLSFFSLGKYYYEVACHDQGLCRVGWSTSQALLDLGKFVMLFQFDFFTDLVMMFFILFYSQGQTSMDLASGELGRSLTISSLTVMERYGVMTVLDLMLFQP